MVLRVSGVPGGTSGLVGAGTGSRHGGPWSSPGVCAAPPSCRRAFRDASQEPAGLYPVAHSVRATRPWAGRREVAESRKRADRRNTMRASPAPRRAARSAATTPAGPAPMTTTSSSSGGDEAITRSSGSAATAVITQAGEADATSRVRDDDVRDDGCAGSSRAGHGSGQLAIAGSACCVSGIRQLTLLAATGS